MHKSRAWSLVTCVTIDALGLVNFAHFMAVADQLQRWTDRLRHLHSNVKGVQQEGIVAGTFV